MPKQIAQHDGNGADDAERLPPAEKVCQKAGQQSAAHAAEARAADVEPHHFPKPLRIEFFTDIGHGDGRNTREKEPKQAPHDKKGGKVRAERCQQAEDGC